MPNNQSMLIQVTILMTFQFKSDSVAVEYQGEVHKFDFEYRDPWEWILALIHDESLAPLCMWNSVQKFHCTGEKEERVVDEPNTGDSWWKADVGIGFMSPKFNGTVNANPYFDSSQVCLKQLMDFLTAIFPYISGWTKEWLQGG